MIIPIFVELPILHGATRMLKVQSLKDQKININHIEGVRIHTDDKTYVDMYSGKSYLIALSLTDVNRKIEKAVRDMYALFTVVRRESEK